MGFVGFGWVLGLGLALFSFGFGLKLGQTQGNLQARPDVSMGI